MSRFQIEDILEQDARGIVYRAKDSTTGDTVAIRRFLPFGSEGGGLDEDEARAFEMAAERLAKIGHDSLRSVIHASVDPIDHIPYLVTEWVEGTSLDKVIDREALTPGHIIDLLRLTLEISIKLSATLGQVAIWVETETGSIIVGSEESGRGFTFWLSPFKWLNSAAHIHDLSPLIELTEELTGWKTKLYKDNSYFGLGGWLKNLKTKPDTSLEEALDSLKALASGETPREAPAPPPLSRPQPPLVGSSNSLPSQPSNAPTLTPKEKSKSPIALIIIALLAIAGGLGYLYVKREPLRDSLTADKGAHTASPAAQEDPLPTAPEEPSPPGIAEDGNDRAANLPSPAVFSPSDHEEFSKKAYKETVRLNGTISAITFSRSRKHIYLIMASPNQPQYIRGVLRSTRKKEASLVRHFNKLKGKKIQISGTRYSDGTPRNLVLLESPSDFKILP